jgi:Dolichyl-phosphate-mannose-protein mannosyltransferase
MDAKEPRMTATDPTPPTSLRPRDYALLLAACGLLFFAGLGRGELWRTEGLRGLVARAMFDSGDWVVPRLFGEPHFAKPPGFYIAVVLCSLPFGEVTELSARLPSAIAASICVLAFAGCFGRRLGRRAGLAAGLMLPMSLLWLDKSTAAEIDMMQVCWIASSILCLLRAVDDPDPRWWLPALLCVAAGFLTKWTAPQFFYFFAVPYLACRGRLRDLLRGPHLLSLAVAVFLSLSWIVLAIGRTSPERFFAMVMQESLPRFLPTHYERNFSLLDALTLPIKFWASLLPWSLPALLALRPTFAARLDVPARRLLIAMHCWLWPSLGFWMLANEHAPRHSFPLAPAVAGFAVLVWHAWDTGRLGFSPLAPRLCGGPGVGGEGGQQPTKNLMMIPRGILTPLTPTLSPRKAGWRGSKVVRPMPLLAAACAAWLAVKVGFVAVIVPMRGEDRQARAIGERLDALVPRGIAVHHNLLNCDESLLFYCRRPVIRHLSIETLPRPEATYWFVRVADWDESAAPGRLLAAVRNEAGEPSALVRVLPERLEPEPEVQARAKFPEQQMNNEQ